LKENKKRHQNIGQHRVIFTGYLLRDWGGFIKGPSMEKSKFFYFGSSHARHSTLICVVPFGTCTGSLHNVQGHRTKPCPIPYPNLNLTLSLKP